MARNSLVAFAQTRFNDARRKAQEALVDFNVADETVFELREEAKRAYDELREFDRQAAKRGLFSFLGL